MGLHLSIVLASCCRRKDETSRERRADVQLLVATAGAQVVAVCGRAAGSSKGCDTIRALVDEVDQSGGRAAEAAKRKGCNDESLGSHAVGLLDHKGTLQTCTGEGLEVFGRASERSMLQICRSPTFIGLQPTASSRIWNLPDCLQIAEGHAGPAACQLPTVLR